MSSLNLILKWIESNTNLVAIAIVFTLAMGICWIFKKPKDFIIALFSRRSPVKVTVPSNNIYGSSTLGSLSSGNLIEARFYLGVNLYKRLSSNIIVNFSDLKIYPKKEIKGIKFTVNPRAYRKSNVFSQIRDLSIKDTNTIIYFATKIRFEEKANLATLEDCKIYPIFLCFNLSIPNYLDNKLFKVPMKNFFRDFIKEFKK